MAFALAACAFSPRASAQVTSPTATAAANPAPETQPTPTAAEIVAKYEAATGGSEALAKFTTRAIRGLYQTEDESSFAAIEEFSEAPNKRYSKISFTNGVTIREVCDGKTAWFEDPVGGVHPFTGVDLESRLRAASFNNGAGLLQLDMPGRVVATAQIGTHTAYQVQFEPYKGYTLVVYFDTTTGLVVRADDIFHHTGGDYSVQTYMEDYRQSDGLLVPFRIRHVEKGNVFTIRVREIKNNPPLDDSVFAKPDTTATTNDQ
jgi:hypothetical protein